MIITTVQQENLSDKTFAVFSDSLSTADLKLSGSYVSGHSDYMDW